MDALETVSGDSTLLSVADFERGISYWLRETNWDRDFHNAFYARMAAANPRGAFDDAWWVSFLPLLHAWKATRPVSGDILTSRARVRFSALSQAWALAVEPNLGEDIGSVDWASVSAFPTLVAEIKNVPRPVFAAKFCHLLAPRLFPIVDNTAMGNTHPTYESCFLAYQRAWRATPRTTRKELLSRLVHCIGAPPFEGFPLKNKAIELCMIGRHQA